MKKLINKFSTFELVLIALSAALGIAVKPVIVPLVHIITGPLYIPGGAAAGAAAAAAALPDGRRLPG